MAGGAERAVVVGSSGGIGRALVEQLRCSNVDVIALSRRVQTGLGVQQIAIDIEDEQTIVFAAEALRQGGSITRVFVATASCMLKGSPQRKATARFVQPTWSAFTPSTQSDQLS
jgi:short-subunit dehydrogenase